MQLFKTILDTSKEAMRQDNKRGVPRHVIGDSFPFKVKMALFHKDGSRNPDPKGGDWLVSPANLSASGGSFQLSLAAVAFQRDTCRVKFSKGDYLLEIPGTLAHYRCYSHYSLCGIAFHFHDTKQQADYLQLLAPVVIGNALTPVPAEQDASGWHKDQYGDGKPNGLSVWRDSPGGRIAAFDLRMHSYIVRWKEGADELELYGLEDTSLTGKTAAEASLTTLSDEQYDEVRWLFSYVVPNLPKAVPRDVRMFFAALVPK